MKIPPQPIKWLQGDERWTVISPLASYAPIIVLSLLVISLIQIAMGAVWISRINGSLSFALVLQPLVLPTLSLFNTVPSAQLHLYSRSNNPHLSLWLCGLMATCYFASFLVSVIVCAPSPPSIPAECAGGYAGGPRISQTYWNANVALWLLSAVGYAVLAVMAALVWRGFKRLERVGPEGAGLPTAARVAGGNVGDEGAGGGVEMQPQETTIRTRGIGEGKRVRDWEDEMLTEEQRQQRLKKAEEKWKKVYGL